MTEKILDIADEVVDAMSGRRLCIPDEFCLKFARKIIIECAELANTAEPHKAGDLILEHWGFEK